jgi:hypothetical protein
LSSDQHWNIKEQKMFEKDIDAVETRGKAKGERQTAMAI